IWQASRHSPAPPDPSDGSIPANALKNRRKPMGSGPAPSALRRTPGSGHPDLPEAGRAPFQPPAGRDVPRIEARARVQFMLGMKRPERVVERLPADRDKIGMAVPHDVFGLPASQDQA